MKKPSREEVMHLFEKKTYIGSQSFDKLEILERVRREKPEWKPLFEFEGKYDSTPKDFHEDENINMAINFRVQK